MTVLIIEDDRQLRGLLERFLSSVGFRVIMCATLDEASRVLAADLPDLILADVGLPDGRSPSLIRALRSRSTRPPVIYMTGETTFVPEADVSGATLRKPFNLADMETVMRSVLPIAGPPWNTGQGQP